MTPPFLFLLLSLQAHFKLGCYAQSAADAEASLELEHGSQKARYRAALAHLMLGQPLAAQPHVAALTAPFGLEAEASAEVKTAAEASGPNAATKVAAPPQLLPAHLAILQEATCAMLRHHTLKHQQEQEQLGAVSTSDRAGGSGRSAAAAGCHRTSELLQVLSDDMDGEADADIVSVLQELSCLLCTSGAARAVFELHNGFPLVLCYLTEAYCSRAAEVLQAASGWQQGQAKRQGYGATALEESQQPGGSNGEQEPGRGAVMWPPLVWRRLVAAAVGGNSAGGGSTLVATAMQLLSWAAGDPWARTQLLVHPLPGAAAEGAVQAQQAQHGQHGQRSAAGCPLEAVVLGLQRLGAAGGLAPAAVPAAVELLARWVCGAIPACMTWAAAQFRVLQGFLHCVMPSPARCLGSEANSSRCRHQAAPPLLMLALLLQVWRRCCQRRGPGRPAPQPPAHSAPGLPGRRATASSCPSRPKWHSPRCLQQWTAIFTARRRAGGPGAAAREAARCV